MYTSPLWTEFLTHVCVNVTFPPATVADGNKRKSPCNCVTAIKIHVARDFLDVSRFGMPMAFFSSDNNFDQ